MPKPVTYLGNSRIINEPGDRPWGVNEQTMHEDHIAGVGAVAGRLGNSTIGSRVTISSTVASLSGGGTLTPTATVQRVVGNGGAVTLGTVTAIADGDYDGQVLVIEGTDDTNHVTIPDAANTKLNGDIRLSDGETLTVYWNSARSAWVEQNRTTL